MDPEGHCQESDNREEQKKEDDAVTPGIPDALINPPDNSQNEYCGETEADTDDIADYESLRPRRSKRNRKPPTYFPDSEKLTVFSVQVLGNNREEKKTLRHT